jgi:hypothetical protein
MGSILSFLLGRRARKRFGLPRTKEYFRWIESVLVIATDHTCSNIISRDYLAGSVSKLLKPDADIYQSN